MRKNWTIRGARAPHQPHRKFTDEDYNDVVTTFDETREELKKRVAHFEADMRAAGRKRSSSKLNAQAKKMWDVRAGVRKKKQSWKNYGRPRRTQRP